MLSNIWNHPKTTIAGVLIAIGTICGVCAQQDITLGNLGSGTVVSFVSALAAAFLGLLAKDPGGSNTGSNSGTKLGVLLLICMIPMAGMIGCDAAKVNQVISQIDAYLPTAVSLVNEALTIYNAVEATDTTKPNAVQSALLVVETDLQAIQKPLSDYLAASASSDKTTAWTAVQAAVDTAVKDSDQLLLVAKVSDPQSKATGTVVIASIDAAVHTMDAFLTAAQTPQQVKAKVAARAVKVSMVSGSWSVIDQEHMAMATGVPYKVLIDRGEAIGF